MIHRCIFLLLFLLGGLTIQAQQKLPGHYDEDARWFYCTDTNVIVHEFHNDRAAFMIKGKNPFIYKSVRVGFIDTTGRVVIKPAYMDCSDFNNGFALVQDTTTKFGVIDKDGKIVIPILYDGIEKCYNGLLVIWKDRKIGLINIENKIILNPDKYSRYATPPPSLDESTDDVGDIHFRWYRRYFANAVQFKKHIGVREGGKWAVINTEGKEIIPPKFDWIGIFNNNNLAPARIGKQQGIIDTTGNFVIPAVYDNTALISDNLVLVTLNKKTGVLSLNNKLLIPIKYDRIEKINKDAFLVASADLFGIISAHGKIIIPVKNQEIRKFGTGYLVSPKNNIAAFFDSKGKQKTDLVDGTRLTGHIWEMGDDRDFMVYNQKKNQYIHYNRIYGLQYYRDKKWGLLDTAGNELTPPLYDTYYKHIRRLLLPERSGMLPVEQNDKAGIINSMGKVVLPIEYDYIQSLSQNFILVKKGDKCGLVDKKLRLLTPIKYDAITLDEHAEYYPQGFSRVISVSIGKKWGYINYKGNEITPIKYDQLNRFQYNLCQVVNDNKCGLIDTMGREIVPCVYDWIQIDQTPLIIVHKDKLWGMIDHSGKIIKPTVYDQISHAYLNGSQIFGYEVTYRGERGLIDLTGKTIIPCQFQQIQYTHEKYYIAQRAGKFGVIDTVGKTLINFDYEWIEAMSSPFDRNKIIFEVKYLGKTGLIDFNGKQLIPCRYDGIFLVRDKIVGASMNKGLGLVNWSGKVIQPFIYQQIYSYTFNFITEANHKYGLLDLSGKQLQPAIYDYINEGPRSYLYICSKDHKISLLNHQGTALTGQVYDTWDFCGSNNIKVTQGDKVGLFNFKGEIIYPCIYKSINCAGDVVITEKY